MYNSSGVKQGAKDKKIDENQGNCTTFAFGSESKCKLSRATVGLGSFILYVQPFSPGPHATRVI